MVQLVKSYKTSPYQNDVVFEGKLFSMPQKQKVKNGLSTQYDAK